MLSFLTVLSSSSFSTNYFRAFEQSRKGSSKKSFFGLRINAEIDGIQDIVKLYCNPYSTVNYTAVILDKYNEIAKKLDVTLEGGNPMPSVSTISFTDYLLQHIMSFLLYTIPFIVIGVLCIFIVIARFVGQRFKGPNFCYNKYCMYASSIIFGVGVVCAIFAIVLFAVGLSTIGDTFRTIWDLPDILVDAQYTIMPYYSNTVNKIYDIGDLWVDSKNVIFTALEKNLTDIGNKLENALENIAKKLTESGDMLTHYNTKMYPVITNLEKEINTYDETKQLAGLFTNLGIVDKVNEIYMSVKKATEIAKDVLDYASKIGNLLKSIDPKLVKSARTALSDKNYTFTPFELNLNLQSAYNVLQAAEYAAIFTIVLFAALCASYLIAILPICKNKFSSIVVKFSLFLPIVSIILLTFIGAAFTIIGGFFAFYANKGVEVTIDNSINELFNIFPERTIKMPSVDLNAVTKGTLDNTIKIPSVVFKTLHIFRRLISVESSTGIYKALDLYKFINPVSILEDVSSILYDLGDVLKVPKSFHDWLDGYYDEIVLSIPIDFNLFFEYKDGEKTKAVVIKEAVEKATKIPADKKNTIVDYINQLNTETDELYRIYDGIASYIKDTINGLIHDIPDQAVNFAAKVLHDIGRTVDLTAPMFDETINQIPIGVVQDVYKTIYNTLFGKIVECSMELSCSSLIGIISMTVLLICMFFISDISNKTKFEGEMNDLSDDEKEEV